MTSDEIQDGQYFYWGPYLWKTKVTQHIVDELLLRAKKTNNKHNKKIFIIIL